MATVRFSKELIEKIVANAMMKWEPAMQRAWNMRPPATWGQRIYDTLFLDAQAFIALAPTGWLRTLSNIEVHSAGDVYCGLSFPLPAPLPWPYWFAENDLARKTSSYGEAITLKDHPVWEEFASELKAYIDARTDVIKRRDEFVEAVKKICNAYSTLAPALKAWPPLWELVPEEVKDKHRQIVEREKKEVELEVDLGKLTAMSTAVKFGL